MAISDKDYERICEAAGLADFVDGHPVMPEVGELVIEIERGRVLIDASEAYWIGRVGPTQKDLKKKIIRERWIRR